MASNAQSGQRAKATILPHLLMVFNRLCPRESLQRGSFSLEGGDLAMLLLLQPPSRGIACQRVLAFCQVCHTASPSCDRTGWLSWATGLPKSLLSLRQKGKILYCTPYRNFPTPSTDPRVRRQQSRGMEDPTPHCPRESCTVRYCVAAPTNL
jgi:hypothetical protein